MKKTILAAFFFAKTLTGLGQPKTTDALNFGFEKRENHMPAGWTTFGGATYKVALDSGNVKTGHYSGCIEFAGDSASFKALAITLPQNYGGERITLTGYIKTENVTDGYAGLWMRIDPSVAFDNMGQNGIRGTTGWQRYSISLAMQPDKTTQIMLGALLAGKGKMWVDDLQVSVDGKDIAGLKPYQRKIYPAELDKEFAARSGTGSIPGDEATVKNLALLGMVWGFVKYYHPAVASGAHNWDYELFRVLPKVVAAKSGGERDAVLVNWINNLGSFEKDTSLQTVSAEVKLQPDLDWIRPAGFSPELTALLQNIKAAKRTGENYYVALAPGVGNPQFTNEAAYHNMNVADAGYRLLSLFRYWNIIQYYFPDRHLIGEDWKGVLKEFVPKFLSNADQSGYTLTVLELIARIHDTHANVWGGSAPIQKFWGSNHSAVRLSFVEDKAVVTGFYNDSAGKATGLQVGDVINKINGRPVTEMVKDRLYRTPASNYPTQLRNIAPDLLRSNDSAITVERERNGKPETITIKAYGDKDLNLYRGSRTNDTCFRLISNDIAYLSNGTLKSKYLPELWKQIRGTKGLIIDNRNYPSEFIIYELSNYLLPQSIPFVKFSNGSLTTPGLFTITPLLNAGKNNPDPYKGKLVILVNETSQSSSEFHAMAYRAFPGAVVVGSTTAGADGNVSQFNLPGGISTMISGIGVYYPDGRETQRIGIVPDVEVKPTVDGIRSGRDEVLEAAVKIINGH